MNKVLVIGGSGFVGHAIVRAFQQDNCSVTVLNRGNKAVPGAEQLVTDRNDAAAVKSALRGRTFDAVIDTNCYTPLQASILVDSCAGTAGKVAFISSAAVYSDASVKEGDRAEGASIWGSYGVDKALAEQVYLTSAGGFDSVLLFRPPYIFGPNNNLDRETWFWARLVHGAAIVLPSDGETRVQFVHEDDVANAIVVALKNASGANIYNVADTAILTFKQLVTLLADVASVRPQIICLGKRNGDVPARSWFPFRDYPCVVDASRLYSAGWSPAFDLKTRFADTYSVARQTNERSTPRLTDFEKSVIAEERMLPQNRA